MNRSPSSRLWLPFTQMAAFDPAQRTFVRGAGNYLYDARDRRLFDAVSSIWTTVHGHAHPYIAEAIAHQAKTLDHATLLGASNPVAESLAQRLTTIAGMDRAFFSGDGASAIEVAIKMALQYWQNTGSPERTRFVHLIESYHGDTAAAMSVSDIALFKGRFGAITFEAIPYGEIAGVLAAPDVAAVIVEPLVQAAAGMRVVAPSIYKRFTAMEPLLIVDEIATGFGRTGTLFAHEQLDLMPDILCVGKGLTGGTLALSGTLVRDRVYEAFLGTHEQMRHLFHGHSFAGNPIACAAANANLDLFERERTLEHVDELVAEFKPQLERLRAHPRVYDVRSAGLMIGIELHTEHIDARGAATPAWRVANDLYECGHFTRPIGDVIQLVPPLSSTAAELRGFVDALLEVLDT